MGWKVGLCGFPNPGRHVSLLRGNAWGKPLKLKNVSDEILMICLFATINYFTALRKDKVGATLKMSIKRYLQILGGMICKLQPRIVQHFHISHQLMQCWLLSVVTNWLFMVLSMYFFSTVVRQ